MIPQAGYPGMYSSVKQVLGLVELILFTRCPPVLARRDADFPASVASPHRCLKDGTELETSTVSPSYSRELLYSMRLAQLDPPFVSPNLKTSSRVLGDTESAGMSSFTSFTTVALVRRESSKEAPPQGLS